LDAIYTAPPLLVMLWSSKAQWTRLLQAIYLPNPGAGVPGPRLFQAIYLLNPGAGVPRPRLLQAIYLPNPSAGVPRPRSLQAIYLVKCGTAKTRLTDCNSPGERSQSTLHPLVATYLFFKLPTYQKFQVLAI